MAYSDGGRPVSTRDALGGVTHYTWDGVGNLLQIVDVDDAVLRFEWGGFRRCVATRFPDGTVKKSLYDREGRLIDQVNERGEVHQIDLDPRGRVIGETTFDGRRLTYAYDLAGRRTKVVNASRELTEYVYNLADDLVEKHLPDGSLEEYSYTPRGDLASVKGPDFALALERDAVGNIVKEEQTFRGRTYVVESGFDRCDARTRRATSLGHLLEVELDAESNRVLARLDRGEVVKSVRDAVGREAQRELGRGGAVHERYDPMGQLLRVWSTATVAGLPPDEPDFIVGDRGVTSDRAYEYTRAGEVAARWDRGRGVTRYEYDLRHRLVAAAPDGKAAELFAHDPTSNLFERGPAAPSRTYGPGNRLLARGGARYEWDADGRLVAKKVPRADGQGDDVWRYEWDARGYLAAVVRPDSDRVEFRYDAFGRRLHKQITAAGKPSRSVRFVWDSGTLVHEIRESAAAAGDPVVEERTYCVDGGKVPMPWAHRDGQGSWAHYVNDLTGAPEHLVDEAGAVVGEIARSAFGVSGPGAGATTPLRFAGQYRDDETELCYNRHRYYDPEVGRYLSPDPIGVEGDINGYRYGRNPIATVDPLGLIWDGTKWVNTASATFTPPGSTNARPFPDPTGMKWANDPGGRHSEGRILDELMKRPDSELKGSTLAIAGDFHSCPACRDEMEAFAKKKEMTIHYCGNHDTDRPRSPPDPRLVTTGPNGVVNPG